MERYADACVTELQRWAQMGGLPLATSVFFGGGTPSRLAPDARPHSRRHPARLERRGDRRVQPRRCRPGASRRLPRAGRHPHVVRPAVHPRPRAGGTGSAPRPRRRRALCGGGACRRLPHLEPRPYLRGRRRDRPGLAAHPGGRPRPAVSAPAPQRLRPDRRARDPAGPGARPAPRRRRVARRYEIADELLSGAGYHWEEISNWARPGHRCRHNGLYWDQGDYPGIGSAAHSHRDGAAGGTSAHPTATSRPRGRPLARGRPRGAHRRPARLRVARTRAPHPRGVPWAELDGPTSWPGWSSAGGTGPSSRCTDGSWPTRSPPELPPVVCTDDRRAEGRPRRAERRERPDGKGRAPLPPPGVHLPLGRDLRRVPLHLRLRPARASTCCGT